MVDVLNRIEFAYAGGEAEAFPPVAPMVLPLGSRVLVQIRTPKSVTKGGIHLITDARDTEFWVTQVAKVIAIGPVAFKNRTTMAPWPEGDWCSPGDYVRVPKHGGDRWTVPIPNTEDEAQFVMFNDLDILGSIPGGWEDAVKIKAFV